MSCVYWIHTPEHTNIFQQGYVGVSKRFERRIWEHLKLSGNAHLKNAINKYGWDNLVKEKVIIADESYCLEMETKLRPKESIGWNIVMGGGMPPIAQKGMGLGRDAWNKGLSNIYSEEHLLNLSNIRKEKYSGENHPRFIDIPKDKLLELLINNNLKEVAEFFNISLDCVRKKIKKYNINYKTIKIKTGPKVGKTPNYYEISDKLFEKILETREKDKKSIEELSDEFKIGINKLRKEFKDRNIIIKKIK
jgi:predicted GIY-YIG superfamily endonuclease